jgi:hypothetical protein
MANHEAYGRRSKARALSWAVLLAAFLAVAPARGLDRWSQGVALAPHATDAGAPVWLAEATGPLQLAEVFAADAPAFTLGLDAAFRVEPFRAGGFDSHAAAALPVGASAALTLADVRAIATAMRQETPASPAADQAKSDGSFGRWMKRHWWVPALVGAAVLATAGESLYDDDDEDDDD